MLHRALLLILVLLLPAAASAKEPWDAPFTDDVEGALAAAAAMDTTNRAGGWPLLVESRYDVNDENLVTRTTRVVTLVIDRDGVSEYGSVGASWAPWYESPATVRARVIKKDGTVGTLDPSTLMQRRIGGEADMYWDRQVLEGPLPGIEIGSLVETEVRVEQHRPFFSAGSVTRSFLVGSSGALVRRVILEHPKSTKLKLSTDLLDAPSKATADGRLRRTWEISPGPVPEDYDPWLPGDLPQFGVVGFSTGSSWKAVATAYAEEVDAKLAGQELLELATEAAGDAIGDRDAVAQRLLSWVQREVRYTGLELGENALIPMFPLSTLERGFGDCKDQSTLLTGMLRALGYEADLALLSASGRRDVDPALPGLGGFDHAIVVVRGEGEPMWIDPTNRFFRAGRVGVALEDRLALIAHPASKGLVPIAASGIADNGWVETRTLRIEDEGSSTLHERTLYSGWNEAEIRGGYTGTTDKARRDYLTDYVVNRYESGELTELTVSDPDDLDIPFSLDLEATGVGLAWSEDDEAWARLPMTSLFRNLDDFFWIEPEDGERTADLYYYGPYTGVLEYVVHPPAGYVVQEAPEPEEFSGGPFTYVSTVTNQDDGSVRVRFESSMAGRRFTPEDQVAMREALSALNRPDPPYLHFVHRSKQLADAGKLDEAIEAARGGRETESALADVRLAELLLTAGAGEAAQMVAARATKTNPELPRAWRLLAWARQHDELGRRLAPGWDRDGSIVAYKKALELNEQDWIARADLSIVLEHDLLGQRYGRGADVEASIEELQTLRSQWEVPTFEDNLLANLFRIGDFEELRKLVPQIGTGTNSSLLVAAAATENPEAALLAARRETTTEGERTELLSAAYLDLYATGRFEAAADLLDQIAEDDGGAEGREIRRILRRAATLDISDSPKNPSDTVLLWLKTVMDPDLSLEAYGELLSAPAMERMTEERMRSWQGDLAAELAPTLNDNGMSPDAAMAMILAGIELREETLDKRTVAVRMSVGLGGDSTAETLVLLKEKGRWGLLGAGDFWEPLGDHAASLVESKPDVARRLLQVAGAELAVDVELAAMVFRRALKVTGPEGTTLAAAVLSCFEPRTECAATIQEGLELFETESGQGLATMHLGELLTELEDWGAAAEFFRGLWAESDDRGSWGPVLVRLLLSAGDPEEAKLVAEATIEGASDPTQAELELQLAQQEHDADLAAAIATMGAIQEHDPTRNYANNRAWYRLIVGQPGPEATEEAQKAARDGSSSSWHTLATAYVEEGRAAEAHDALLRAMSAGDRSRPSSDDWYVIGRIAQLYGEPEAARRAFERVQKPTRPNQHDSTWELATRRLTELVEGP
ncbi:MAG: DUF3857 domain-containing protein [Proteobacteria bacterium]|nr:DUF3857 domain-containing protein [Pseudomonadota bacterium]